MQIIKIFYWLKW